LGDDLAKESRLEKKKPGGEEKTSVDPITDVVFLRRGLEEEKKKRWGAILLLSSALHAQIMLEVGGKGGGEPLKEKKKGSWGEGSPWSIHQIRSCLLRKKNR